MRVLATCCIVPLAFLATLAFAGDPVERSWTGILPNPTSPKKDEIPNWYVCRILDAETGKPVPGARLIRTPERGTSWTRAQDTVLAVGVADADGVAHVSTTPEAWTNDCHWLVIAPGYAFAHDYGKAPEAEVLLERGVPFAGRVLDPMGRPVDGALVELLGGCSHGTPGARAIADGGVFRFDRAPGRLGGQIWIDGRGIAADLVAFDRPSSLGAGGVDLVMEPGLRYEGRVVDALGRPMADVVVRALNEERGPVTVTDRSGRFVLDGVERGGLYFFPPASLLEDGRHSSVDDAHPGIPMTVVLGPLGVAEEERTARIRVRAVIPDGEEDADDEWSFDLVNTATGRGPWGSLGDDEPEEVVPGTYRVLASPFSRFDCAPAEVVARAGATTEVVLRHERRPRVEVEGGVPAGATLTVAIPGAASEILDGETPLHLAAAEPAVLRVEIDGRPPFFFPVGPARDGVRRVTVYLPAPRRVIPPSGSKDARLYDGPREAYGYVDDGVVLTDAWGKLTLVYSDDAHDVWEVTVDVPAEAGAEVKAAADAVRPARPQFWGYVSPPSVEVRVFGVAADEAPEILEELPGEPFLIERDGYRKLRGVAPQSGSKTLRWGPGALSLRIREADGTPVDAIVLAGGEVYAAPKGRLDLRGFDPGRLRVVVARRDLVGVGRELWLVLLEEGVLEREVVLEEE